MLNGSVASFPVKDKVVEPPVMAVATAMRRSVVADIIAQVLFSQYARENSGRAMRMQDAPRDIVQRFRQAGEFIVQLTLHDDLERTAVMAAADILCQGSYGDSEMSIVDVSEQTAAHYFKLAEVAMRAHRQTLVFQSPDAHKDADYCGLLDALEQKGLV